MFHSVKDSSENSKAKHDRNYERSGGIWKNLFGGSRRKIAKKIAKKALLWQHTLRPRSRMLLKGDEGGLGGHYPLGHLRRGGGGHHPLDQISALRVTGDPPFDPRLRRSVAS